VSSYQFTKEKHFKNISQDLIEPDDLEMQQKLELLTELLENEVNTL
jgi:hypothetical protein